MDRARIFSLTFAMGLAAGCGGPDLDPADEVDTGEDLLAGAGISEAMSTSCTAQKIRDATPASRRDAIDRALRWVRLKVPYSQTHYFEGWRQDCSGFVSMAWDLNRSRTTANFAPYETDISHRISADNLVPGDALNRVNPRGHIMLFGGWADRHGNVACVIEESTYGLPAIIAARSTSGFAPIRYDHFK